MKGFTPEELALLREADEKIDREEGLTEAEIQKALNHSSATITRRYTMADELALR